MVKSDNKPIKKSATAKQCWTLEIFYESNGGFHDPICFDVQIQTMEIGACVHTRHHSCYGLCYP